jgi:hypothetical protein
MTTEIRFPSGATLRQVKKDAKTLKRELNIAHHEALNAAAKQHGFNLDWRELQSRLDRGGVLVDLKFQCNVSLPLTLLRPAGMIIGPTGSGKTAVAAELCVNVLREGIPVVYLVYDFMRPYSTIPGYIADAMRSPSANVVGFKTQTITTDVSLADVLEGIAPRPGTLIILEEPQALSGLDTAALRNACVKWQVGFVGLVQHADASRHNIEACLSFIIDATDLNGDGSTLSIHHTDSLARVRQSRLKVINTHQSVFHTFAAVIQRPD